VGGLRFYDRKEIKDALAWLRLIANPASDVDCVRAIGAPSRGVGKTSLERLADMAATAGVPLLEAARRVGRGEEPLPGRARKGVAEFAAVADELIGGQGKEPLVSFVERVLRDSGYVASLEAEKTSEAQDRIDNLSELVAAIDEYASLEPEGTLAGFLEQAALATDVDALKAEGGVVSLMSLHTAKGLEFKVVHLTGLEDGLFPHSRSVNDRAALEEERRLCYVGITRARERLHLSAARVRAVFGEPRLSELSRFVGEIPAELLEVAQAGFLPGGFGQASAPVRRHDPGLYDELAQPPPDDDLETAPRAASRAPRDDASPPGHGDGSFAPGSRVFHASFGEGFVVEADGTGARQKLVIDFPPPVGRKVIVARFVDRR